MRVCSAPGGAGDVGERKARGARLVVAVFNNTPPVSTRNKSTRATWSTDRLVLLQTREREGDSEARARLASRSRVGDATTARPTRQLGSDNRS